MSEPKQHLIDVDGATLEVVEVDGNGPIVCITHPSWEEEIEQWVERLGNLHLVVILPRGLGKSSPVRRQREMTFSQLADDVEAVRQRLGVSRWIYLGDSSGGCVALLYALRCPQSLAGLIVGFSTANFLRNVVDPAFQHDFRPFFEKLPDGSWINLAYRTMDLSIQLRANLDELGTFDVLDRLGEIAVPTLVIAGQQDIAHPPSQARAIHAGIPGSEFLLLERSGHGVSPEDREIYRAAVQRFVGRLE
jgi:pimeloyl-ACP methyl ester carboxylesterase